MKTGFNELMNSLDREDQRIMELEYILPKTFQVEMHREKITEKKKNLRKLSTVGKVQKA